VICSVCTSKGNDAMSAHGTFSTKSPIWTFFIAGILR
jgi:hypothetical protein